MAIRFERKAVLAKIESAYGTDPTPTGGANAVLLKAVEVNPINGERIPREIIRAGYGNMAGWLVGRHVSITARIDLASSGTLGTAPAFGPLLRACGLAETITADTKVDYTRIDTGFESNTIYFNHEGTRHIATGVRGNGKFRFTKNRPPEIELNLLGLWVSDSAVALPALTTTAWKDPLPSTKANTPTYTIDAQAVAASSFELDLGMDCAYLERINRQEIIVRERKPKLTTLIEELPFGTKNFFGMVGGASVALAYTHGVGAGNVVEITLPQIQLQDVQRQEEETETMLNISANALIGSPEFTISFK